MPDNREVAVVVAIGIVACGIASMLCRVAARVIEGFVAAMVVVQ